MVSIIKKYKDARFYFPLLRGVWDVSLVLYMYFLAAFFLITPGYSQVTTSTTNQNLQRLSQIHLTQNVENKESIHIGDTINFSIHITHPKGETFFLPQTLSVEPFHLIDSSIERSDTTHTIVLKLSHFEIGNFSIPEIPIGKGELIIKTKPEHVVINSIFPKDFEITQIPTSTLMAQIETISHPFDITQNDYTYVYILAAILGILCISIISITLKRYMRKKIPLMPDEPKPVILPDQLALGKLKKLQESSLLAEGKFATYHEQISEIIREYIENKYHVHALEMTCHEILIWAKSKYVEGMNYDDLKDLLGITDLVKFAKMSPSDSTNHWVMKTGIEFIHATTTQTQAASKTQP